MAFFYLRNKQQKEEESSNKKAITTVPIEKQIEALEECGISFNEGIGVNVLLESWDKEKYEGEPYSLLLVMSQVLGWK